MENLLNAVSVLAAKAHPDMVVGLAQRIREVSGPNSTDGIRRWVASPTLTPLVAELLVQWAQTTVSPLELAGMLIGAGQAAKDATAAQKIELVWTGPSSRLVATRKTEQVLLQVIQEAQQELFMTSFVAYKVGTVMAALADAIDRGVQVSLLLESSEKHGGVVKNDGIGMMRAALPSAMLYAWLAKSDSFEGGKVHAKIAVADRQLCFVSSANLTGHALEKNMEAGFLVRSGPIPRNLHDHLVALVGTGVITRV